jgi:hypothetical protein
MGTIIGFPEREHRTRAQRSLAAKSQSAKALRSATIVILPVIRIERFIDDTDQPASRSHRRRRRRRAVHS